MSDSKPPRGPYRGPPSQSRDKRERQRDRVQAQNGAPRRPAARVEAEAVPAVARGPREQRLYGLNACLAMFARRPGDLRKVWLLESRIPRLKDVLAYCVKHRIGYTVVDEPDLQKLAASQHHEGVVFGVAPAPELSLSGWLRDLPEGPALALWLDGVGNPHNLGAILRSAAHFGVAGLMLPKDSSLALSGAAARVAEGGAEVVPLVRLGRADNSLAQLRSAGFGVAATVVRGGEPLFAADLPPRLLLVMGAEQTGVDPLLADAAAMRLGIPGTGAVESLNVASASTVFLAEWWRRHRA